ncbi:Concanavalin A-like lectin/glucanases superfamily protein [uncultured archaeon]|nr:Concanavalin A-like lectin/glucanases superfamily protein [uncultured archaeon]
MRKMVYALLACLLFTPIVAAAWANLSFDRCANITIKNAGSSALSNYPAYINLTYDSDMLANYSDLRFYNSSCDNSGTVIDYEIENYTVANATIWVRLPSLPTGNTTIAVYYKNNTAVSSGQNASGVWDSNFKGVWHLDENPSVAAPQMKDSTSNGHHGTIINLTSSDQVAGKTDGSLQFDGVSKFVNASDISATSVSTSMTISAWIKVQNRTNGYIVDESNTTTGYVPYGFIFTRTTTGSGAGRMDTILNNGARMSTPSNSVPYNTWTYVAFTWNGTSVIGYINGAAVNTTSYSTSITSVTNSNILIGKRWPSNSQFNGTIDEVCISNISRSANWINQSYQLVINQSSYVIFGSEQTRPVYDFTVSPTVDNFSVVNNTYADRNYTLTNTGNRALNITCGANVTWATNTTACPTNFAAAASQNVTFRFNATSQSAGNPQVLLNFSNTNVNKTATANVTITAASTPVVALALLQPASATVTDPFTPFLQNCNASCSGSTCTSVNMTVQYSNDSGANYFDMNASTQLNTSTAQPQTCGDISASSSCNRTWSVAGKTPGAYKIRCRSVSGSAPANSSATPPFDITASAFVETSISPGSVAFGSFDPATSDNAASNNPINITVTSNTNVNVDTYISATDLANASSTIAAGNMSVSRTGGGARTALTNLFPGTPYYSDVAPNGIEQYFFYLTIPAGQNSGDYTGAVAIKTVQIGAAP